MLVAVALGGVLGAEARYGLATAWPHATASFPWSTLVINAVGCLLIGVLMVAITEVVTPHPLARPFLGIGVLGGFTTFSTYTVDTQRLLVAGRPGLAVAYVLATLTVALASVAAGSAVTRLFGARARTGDAHARGARP